MLSDEAIVITGLGTVTPIGIGKDAFWDALIAGDNGIRRITSFDTRDFRTHRGGEVRGFDPEAYCRIVKADRIGRGAQMAIAAARLALEDAGLFPSPYSPLRSAVILGTTMGESPIAESMTDAEGAAQKYPLNTGSREKLSLSFPHEVIPTSVAREFGFGGPVSMISTACAAGNYAISYGADLLSLHQADLVLAGGADPLSRVAFTGFNSMLAVAPEICQPFDRCRKGISVSEGAAVLMLERYGSARRRGAQIYAEVAGCGIANDAYHMTAPHPEGRGATRSIANALAAARVNPHEVDYISAHGTGTLANDRIETRAIKNVFGDAAYVTPVSSIKSMLGHTMGAASASEAAACCLSIQHGILPPTINYCETDPECDLDYVPNVARDKRVRTILSNSFAFGGNCAALVLRAV